MPRLPIGIHFIAHGLLPVQFVFCYVAAELFKPSIMMISDVGVGLAQFLGNLCERVTLEEVKPECFSLILCEVLYDFLPSIPAEKPFDGTVVVCSFIVGVTTFICFVRDSGQIEPLALQSPSTQESLSVGDLDNPRTG